MNQTGRTSHEDICSSLDLFAREVMPEFQAREPEHQRWKADVLAGRIDLERLDTQPHTVYAHQNEDIVRLTPEELKRKMAEKEAAQAAAGGRPWLSPRSGRVTVRAAPLRPAEPFTKSLERMNYFQEPEARTLIADLELPPGSSGLDAGCGVGLYALWLAEAVGSAGPRARGSSRRPSAWRRRANWWASASMRAASSSAKGMRRRSG